MPPGFAGKLYASIGRSQPNYGPCFRLLLKQAVCGEYQARYAKFLWLSEPSRYITGEIWHRDQAENATYPHRASQEIVQTYLSSPHKRQLNAALSPSTGLLEVRGESVGSSWAGDSKIRKLRIPETNHDITSTLNYC